MDRQRNLIVSVQNTIKGLSWADMTATVELMQN
jgi:hypothetical protein